MATMVTIPLNDLFKKLNNRPISINRLLQKYINFLLFEICVNFMEPWGKEFCSHNDEIFSNIFNGNIPSLIIKIDITQLPESPFQNPEPMQEVGISSTHTISGKDKRSIHDDDLKNSIREPKRQIFESSYKSAECFQEVTVQSLPTVSGKRKILIDNENVKNALRKIKHQILKSTPQCTKYLQNTISESEPSILGEVQIPIDDLENAVKKIKCQTNMNQIPKQLLQNIEFLKEPLVDSEFNPSEERLNSNEYFKDIISELILLDETETSHTRENPTLDLQPQNTENLQEIYVESVAGKRKRESVDEVSENLAKKIKCSSSESENMEETFIRSKATFLKESQNHGDNFQNIERIGEFRTSANQTLPQNSNYLQETSIASEFNFLDETGTADENFTNIVQKKLHIDINETLESPFECTEDLQQIPIDFVTGTIKKLTFHEEDIYVEEKNKRELLNPPLQKTKHFPEVSSKSVSVASRKRKIVDADFKNTLKKMKRQYKSELQISSSAVQVMNDLISHLFDKFDEELHSLKKVRRIKTLTETELELVIKHSLSKVLFVRAMKYGRLAIQAAKNTG